MSRREIFLKKSRDNWQTCIKGITIQPHQVSNMEELASRQEHVQLLMEQLVGVCLMIFLVNEVRAVRSTFSDLDEKWRR